MMTLVTPATGAYPIRQAVDVALKDGSAVHVRPVRQSDRDAIHAFLSGMSTDSLYLRTCGIADVDWLSNWSVEVDYHDSYGLVVTQGADRRVVAHAAYVRCGPRRAEVAFEVADELHGQGLGTLLLAHLAGVAVTNGISEFVAEVMPSNRKMLDVLHASGFPITNEMTDGLTDVVLDTSLSPATLACFDERERAAAATAVGSLLQPGTVAIIGASDRDGTLGAELFGRARDAGYQGGLYPVNRHRRDIHGIPAVSRIADVPGPVDLAVVAVPAAEVLAVARECGAAGTRALVVISSGFAESGPAGVDRQRELLSVCRDAGMRLLGPNSVGVVNTDPAVALNASVVGPLPTRGPVALMSQSGRVGIALVSAAEREGIGLSSFVSVGNRADISGNDLLAYWERDPATAVILLYLESFGNPRRFARTARRISAQKPIIAVKSGRTPVGQVGGDSVTARLLSRSDLGVDALFRQAGVIRTDTIAELIDTAKLLGAQRAPAGNRVGIISNSGGPARICADACRDAGLAVAPLSDGLSRSTTAAGAMGANPINLTAGATADDFRRAIEAVATSGECDAVLTLGVPSLQATAAEISDAVDAVAATVPAITFASVLMDRCMPPRRHPGRRGAARFMFPEDAARALGHAAWWSHCRSPRAPLPDPPTGARPEEARTLITRALTAGCTWLSAADLTELLGCHGLRLDADADVVPVIGELRLALGVVHDESFGPLIVCGDAAAGRVAVRITPLTPTDVGEMLSELGPALRDSAPGPTQGPSSAGAESVSDVLLRLGAMVEAHPQIVAVDLDVLVPSSGVRIVAASVRLEQGVSARPVGALL